MSSDVRRLEVWSDLQAAGGSRLDVVSLSALTDLEEVRNIDLEDRLTLVVDNRLNKLAQMTPDRVLRVLFVDGSFDEWRIRELEDGLTKGTTRVLCDGHALELGNYQLLTTTTTSSGFVSPTVSFVNVLPSEVVTSVLGACPAWWGAGTITPTTRVTFTVEWPTPLAVLRALIVALKALQVPAELQPRRNGTTQYLIDVVSAIGSTAPVIDVRSKKNLLDLTRKRLRRGVTRAYPKGASATVRSGAATMGLNVWRVASVVGSDVELRGLEGCADPIGYDNQLNGLYLVKTDGTRTQITASVAATQKVTVASAASIVAEQWLRVAANTAGDDLVFLDRPGLTPVRSAIVPTEYSDRTNWVFNPTFARWTAGSPDGWTETDSASVLTVAEDTTRSYFGTRSAKLTFAHPGPAAGIPTARLASRSLAVAPSATSRTWTASAWVYFDHAASTLGSCIIRLNIGATNTDVTMSAAAPTPLNSWVRIDATATMTGAAVTAYLEIRAVSNAAMTGIVNFGGLLLEEVGTGRATFISGAEASFAWAAGNAYLADNGGVLTSITADVADLELWDHAVLGWQELTLGATAKIRAPELAVTDTLRLVERVRKFKHPLAGRASFDRRRPDLVRSIATGQV